MKSIIYRHAWGAGLTDEEARVNKFGELLHEADTSASYEVETAVLHKGADGRYSMLEANGCSCWAGDYDGWSFTKNELLRWARKNASKDERLYAHRLLANWIMEHQEEL